MASMPAEAHSTPSSHPTASTAPRSWSARLTGALSATLGAIAGVAPHVLHHIGPLAGAALITGATGGILFGLIGLG